MIGRHEPEPSTVLLVARTTRSWLHVAVAARKTVAGDAAVASRTLRRDPGRIGHALDLQLRTAEPVRIDKVVALVTARDVAISEPAVAAAELLADAPDFDALLVEHELAWRQLWCRPAACTERRTAVTSSGTSRSSTRC